MRKLFISIFLFCALSVSYGQIIIGVIASSGGVHYCTEYLTVYNAMTNKPSDAVAGYENTFVVAAKAHGYWTKLDCFWFFANSVNTASEALLNWIAPSGDDNCTNVHSTAWTTLQGFTGDGSADYLDTNFNPSTEGVNYTQDACSFGAYCRLDITGDTWEIAASDLTYQAGLQARNSTTFRSTTNDATASTWTTATGLGFYVATRSNSTTKTGYKNAADLGDKTVTSTGLPNANFHILNRRTGNYSTNQVAAAFIGGLLTDQNVIDFNTDLEVLMDALGTGIE
jgi:hypothetical protein